MNSHYHLLIRVLLFLFNIPGWDISSLVSVQARSSKNFSCNCTIVSGNKYSFPPLGICGYMMPLVYLKFCVDDSESLLMKIVSIQIFYENVTIQWGISAFLVNLVTHVSWPCGRVYFDPWDSCLMCSIFPRALHSIWERISSRSSHERDEERNFWV